MRSILRGTPISSWIAIVCIVPMVGGCLSAEDPPPCGSSILADPPTIRAGDTTIIKAIVVNCDGSRMVWQDSGCGMGPWLSPAYEIRGSAHTQTCLWMYTSHEVGPGETLDLSTTWNGTIAEFVTHETSSSDGRQQIRPEYDWRLATPGEYTVYTIVGEHRAEARVTVRE